MSTFEIAIQSIANSPADFAVVRRAFAESDKALNTPDQLALYRPSFIASTLVDYADKREDASSFDAKRARRLALRFMNVVEREQPESPSVSLNRALSVRLDGLRDGELFTLADFYKSGVSALPSLLETQFEREFKTMVERTQLAIVNEMKRRKLTSREFASFLPKHSGLTERE